MALLASSVPHTHTDTHTDITRTFFAAVDAMPRGRIAVSPHFNMLDGARALEVGNPRLDTGLMPVRAVDVAFDVKKELDLAQVAAVMNRLVVLYTDWLGGLPLLVTVLSCRYVVDYLEKMDTEVIAGCSNGSSAELNACDGANDNSTSNGQTDGAGGPVANVLRPFVAALCFVVGFTRDVALSVLYDEEDVTTRAMDFTFSRERPAAVAEQLDAAAAWLDVPDRNKHALAAAARDLVRLARRLVALLAVLEVRGGIFAAPGAAIESICSVMADAEKIAVRLQPLKHAPVPDGSFSHFVQLYCNNRHIPGKVVEGNQDGAYGEVARTVASVRLFVEALLRVRTSRHLHTYLEYTAPQMALRFGVVARGLFQLYLVRDDRSLAALAETVLSFAEALADGLCARDAVPLFRPDLWPEAARDAAQDRALLLCADLETTVFHQLGAWAANPCRRRQLDSRAIVMWDLLQATAEQLEVELFSHGVGDRLPSEEPALAVLSFVYYQKLVVMADVASAGFAHELYMPGEAAQMMWLLGYLHQHAHEHLTRRVQVVNDAKAMGPAQWSKKIKRTKAGPKKDAYRAALRRAEAAVPQAEENLRVLTNFRAPAHFAQLLVANAVSHAINLFCACLSTPIHALSRDQYGLRMKPWASVGVPEMPTFEHWQKLAEPYRALAAIVGQLPDNFLDAARSQVAALAQAINEKLARAAAACTELLTGLTKLEGVIAYEGGDADVRAHFDLLARTCVAYKIEVGRAQKTLASGRALTLASRPGYLECIPIYHLH